MAWSKSLRYFKAYHAPFFSFFKNDRNDLMIIMEMTNEEFELARDGLIRAYLERIKPEDFRINNNVSIESKVKARIPKVKFTPKTNELCLKKV